jgi:hypothetical protein
MELSELEIMERHVNSTRNRRDEQRKHVASLERNIESKVDEVRSIEIRDNLLVAAQQAEHTASSLKFRELFCTRYGDTSLDLLDIAEVVADASLSIGNIPASVAALITIKIAQIGIERFCSMR